MKKNLGEGFSALAQEALKTYAPDGPLTSSRWL